MPTFRVTICSPICRVYSVKAEDEEEAENKALYLGHYDPGDVEEMVDEEWEQNEYVSDIECLDDDEEAVNPDPEAGGPGGDKCVSHTK